MTLSFRDLFARTCILGGDKLVNFGGNDLLVLGSDEDGGDTDQLKFGNRYDALCEEAFGNGGRLGAAGRLASSAFPR